jgi:hypothetical protein
MRQAFERHIYFFPEPEKKTSALLKSTQKEIQPKSKKDPHRPTFSFIFSRPAPTVDISKPLRYTL